MDGILTGCDREQEWLLPWWYSNLRKQNPELPIAFGDLGMTKKGLDWCKKRGDLIPASQIPPLPSPPTNENGMNYRGTQWRTEQEPRSPAWFRKPLLMKQSPFKRTIWLDLDCSVLGSLGPLYRLQLPPTKMAIRKDSCCYKMISTDKKNTFKVRACNSGVVLFEKNSPLLDFWERMTLESFPYFYADDQILAFAIEKCGFSVGKIPFKYNWVVYWGPNPEAVVVHWTGTRAKTLLKLTIHAEQKFIYDL